MSFENLGFERPAELHHGWQEGEDAVEVLAGAVGRALAARSEDSMLPLVVVASELEEAGNDDYARLLVQAMMIYLSGEPLPSEQEEFGELLLGSASYPRLLDQTIRGESASAPLLRAAVLTLAGRIASTERNYQVAASTAEAAAQAWEQLGNRELVIDALIANAASFAYMEDYARAEAINERALTLVSESGDRRIEAMLLLNNTQNALSAGDLAVARTRASQASSIISSLRDGHLSASLRMVEAAISIEEGDFEAARQGLKKAAASARRRGDLRQEVVASGNLAKLIADHFSPSGGSLWLERARDAARESHDWRGEQALERSLGTRLADLARYPEAVQAFERALAINERFDDPIAAAQTRADYGASLLSWATDRGAPAEPAAPSLEEAQVVLMRAWRELESLREYDWAAIAVRNLRTVWMLDESGSEVGEAALLTSSEAASTVAPEYSAELARNAGLLMVQREGPARDEGARLIIESDLRRAGSDDARVSLLVADAHDLTDRHSLPAVAISLYDAALSILDAGIEATLRGNIQNDAALAAAAAGANRDAEARLLEAEGLARSTGDRVLLSLATLNLGELAARSDRPEAARDRFGEAAALFEETGELDRAAEAWASIANTWVDDESQSAETEAETAAARARKLAEESKSPDALARALSATATTQYKKSNFEEAYRLWTRCASIVENRDAGEYFAFALDSLARLGDWPRFKRELNRLGGLAQETHSQVSFADKLYLSATTWLRGNRPQPAGSVLAYIVLLTIDGLSRSEQVPRTAAQLVRDAETFGTAIGYASGLLTLPDLPDSQRSRVRTAFERTVRRVAGDEADQILQWIYQYFHDED